MSESIAYYNEHAQAFLDETLHVDMSALYDSFLPHLPEKAHILDASFWPAATALRPSTPLKSWLALHPGL